MLNSLAKQIHVLLHLDSVSPHCHQDAHCPVSPVSRFEVLLCACRAFLLGRAVNKGMTAKLPTFAITTCPQGALNILRTLYARTA